MKYLPIATPLFNEKGQMIDLPSPVAWRVGPHNEELRLLTCERHDDVPLLTYPAIAIPPVTEAAIRGWQRGLVLMEDDEDKWFDLSEHEAFEWFPDDTDPEVIRRLAAVWERQLERAKTYAREQLKQEKGDTE